MSNNDTQDFKLNGYDLSRDFFDYCFDNPEKINPTHIALYFFIIEHCNRLGWRAKFGLPTEMTKEAIGVKNYKTYAKAFTDLVSWGFIKVIQKSKNQYSANVIAVVKNTKAHTKALTKAMQKHTAKQAQSTVDINKPINQLTIKPKNKKARARTFEDEIETLKEHYKTLWRQTSDISERDLIVSIIKLIENEHLEAVCMKPEHPTNSDITRWVQKYTTNDVLTTVRAMENSPKSFKDKKSMRLTFNNWLARE